MPSFPEAEALSAEIQNAEVRKAFCAIDRSLFVPDSQRHHVWADMPLPIEEGATISQPSLVARMTALLEPAPHLRVLEIGTGSGYQTAILAGLFADVHTVEISRLLASNAQARLRQLGIANAHCHVADGAKGWPEAAPYDRVIATVAFPSQPDALLYQLGDGGICIAPVGQPGGTQTIIRYRKHGTETESQRLLPVRFLSLR